MTQGVAVGFSPAVAPAASGGIAAAAAAGTEGAGGGLFAALLALLGARPATAGGDMSPPIPTASTLAPVDASGAAPMLVFDLAKAAPAVDASATSVPEPTAATEQGKAVLKTLGDALIALNDAADAREPPDPALENKLDDALDAVAAYLGVTLPAPAPVAPAITAGAGGAGAIPDIATVTPALPAPAAPGALPTPTSGAGEAGTDDGNGEAEAAEPMSKATILPLPDSDIPLVAVAAPAKAQAAPVADDEIPATVAADAGPTAEAANDPTTEVATPSSATPKPVAEDLPAPIARLAKLLGGLAEKVEQQSPQLARKLEALADQLKAGKLPEPVLAALTGDDGTSAEPQLARIIEALSTQKPTTPAAASPAPQAFVAPSLELPGTLAPATSEDTPTAPQPPDAPKADAADRPAKQARPAPDADPGPQANEHKQATPAPTAKPEPAPAQSTDPSAPAVQQAAAASTTAAPARAVHAAYQAPVQQVNLPQVAFEVVRQFQAGNTRFQIRLDPPELGRIDVKLDVDKSGTVNARMTVERPETLDLMQRDQRALQQALQQAGLDSSKTSLEFSLRQNPFAQQQGTGDGRNSQPSFIPGGTAGGDEIAEVPPTANLYRGTATAGGVNLFV